MPESKYSEKDGIKAIIALQGMVSIKETEEKAKRGWASMSDREKEITMETYKHMTKGQKKNGL